MESELAKYKRLYEDLQNTLDAPSAVPLDCPRVEAHSAVWNPDECNITEWNQIVKRLYIPKRERIIDYFDRAWVSDLTDGICPCKHPILVRIVKKKVVKNPKYGQTAEYTVILQQRRTGMDTGISKTIGALFRYGNIQYL